MIEKKGWELMEALKKLGMKIAIFEDGGLWVFTSFVPADNKINFYHRLIGKNLSFIEVSSIQVNNLEAIHTKIDAIEEVETWIHKDCKFWIFV